MSLGSALLTIPTFATWAAYGGYALLRTPVGQFATASALIVGAPYIYLKHFGPTGEHRKIITDWTRYTFAPEALLGASLYASFAIFPPLPKFIGYVAYSAVFSSVGRFAAAATTALGSAYFYINYRQATKLPEKWTDLSWGKLLPEGLAILSVFASISIFRPALLNQLSGFNPTFAGLPYKAAALCGSGLSALSNTIYSTVTTRALDYIANPIKIADWVVYTAADNLAFWTKEYITNLQLQREVYGYTEIGERDKNLSGIELYNIDLQSLQILGFSLPFSASSIRTRGSWVFSFLAYPIPYLNNAINMAGLTPVASILNTISATAFTTTALSVMSIGLSATSIGISFVTQFRLADSFSIYNKHYEQAIKVQQKAVTEIEEKFKSLETRLTRIAQHPPADAAKYDKIKALHRSFTNAPDIKEILLTFSKFKDKSKSDYLYAFAIKLLEAGITSSEQVKLLMSSVIMNQDNFNNYIAHLIDPETKIFSGSTDITQHAKSLDAYLTFVIHNLGIEAERAAITTTEALLPLPEFVTREANLRTEHKQVAPGETPPDTPEHITKAEEKFLLDLDNIAGADQAAAVQVLLQKVNSIEKPATSPFDNIIPQARDSIKGVFGR